VKSDSIRAVQWNGRTLRLLDQRALPTRELWIDLSTWQAVASAISDMVVRGAPAIAITAAYGIALAVRAGQDRATASAGLLAARPTAVNLRWALERLQDVADADIDAEARRIHEEDVAINHALGRHGAPLLTGGVLTICNTGALATGGHGTALGKVRSALAAGSDVHVYACETRPYLQGARLTAWECVQDGIPCTLISDSMAAALMQAGRVSSVIAGCDRVAENGDTANKIGTYGLAVLARHHGLPFYIAMPTSTLDRRCPAGTDIPIEQRPPDELRRMAGQNTAPTEVGVWNPAFDVTPAGLITAWVTEHGQWRPPFPEVS
jgi:methylthioribose-1-phosphate isomerase